MITAGIDVGVKNVKVVIVKDGEVIASGMAPSEGFERGNVAEKLYSDLLAQAGVPASDVNNAVATGTGKTDVRFTDNNVVETMADVRGALRLSPAARTVIDIGAEQVRVVKYDKTGKVSNYVLNQQCGAGLGMFAEAMARALGVTPDEMSLLMPSSDSDTAVNGECGVYASLDIATLIHNNTPKADIVRAILDMIANKISSTANLTNIDEPVALVGGMAHNAGVVAALKRRMGVDFLIPQEPEMTGALGAALIGAE